MQSIRHDDPPPSSTVYSTARPMRMISLCAALIIHTWRPILKQMMMMTTTNVYLQAHAQALAQIFDGKWVFQNLTRPGGQGPGTGIFVTAKCGIINPADHDDEKPNWLTVIDFDSTKRTMILNEVEQTVVGEDPFEVFDAEAVTLIVSCTL